jgi:hypothetical protein
LLGNSISLATIIPDSFTLSLAKVGSVISPFKIICFKLSNMSTTSSLTFGIVENSWSIPEIRTPVIAKPGKFYNKTRRSALPIVVLCPFIKGPIEYLE